MKKQIYMFVGLFIVLTISSVTAIQAQSARTLKAQIPFDFSVRNQTMKAGEYVVNQTDDQGSVWMLRSRENRQALFLLAMVNAPKTIPDKGKMTFRRYGNRYFLKDFDALGSHIELGKSRAERQLEKSLQEDHRLAGNNGKAATPEIVSIEISM